MRGEGEPRLIPGSRSQEKALPGLPNSILQVFMGVPIYTCLCQGFRGGNFLVHAVVLVHGHVRQISE